MMRALALALIGSVLLGGCAALSADSPAVEGRQETLVPLAGGPSSQPATPEPPALAPMPAPVSPLLAQERAACLRAGGQMTSRGGGLLSCIHPTRDAGRSCTAASDCEGLCLARSGTCAPYQPLFGCHEVFTAPGRRETLCVD